jgi:MFS family permease
VLLLIDTILILVFCKEMKRHNSPEIWPRREDRSLRERLNSILRLQPFWSSMAFFAGLFGSFLSFAEVWNIQFQIQVFHHSTNLAPLINSTVIMGLAIGSIASGAIAEHRGYTWPARIGAGLTLLMLLLLLYGVLPLWLAVLSQGLLGLGMGTAALGLTALRASVPANDFPLASSLMLTGVFTSAGLLSAAVGWSASDLSIMPSSFSHYQQALGWFIAFAGMACTASLTMSDKVWSEHPLQPPGKT